MKFEKSATELSVSESRILVNAIWRDRGERVSESRLSAMSQRLSFGMKFALLAIFVGLAVSAVFAAVTGSISGTARDTQGAVIPDATVSLRNVQTGVVQTIHTDSAGFYNFPSLPLGHYDITFEKAGFGNFEQTDVLIDVDTQRRVDATMPVGTNQQKVTVVSTTAQVDTVSAQ